MNFSILITIIIFAIILGVIVYHITKENKGLTVLTEMIIIIISILVSWLKTDDNEIEYTSNPITTTVETLEQTEPKTDNLTSHKNTTTSGTGSPKFGLPFSASYEPRTISLILSIT